MPTKSAFIRLTGMLAVLAASAARPAAPNYSAAIPALEQTVREQMATYGITGVALALVDDQQLVHVAGYGIADKDSIFRCGSISKLFNAVAVMQLVEAGKLDLDAPVQRYLPDFSMVNPFGDAGPITLRQLLCHRSGMVREAPVGGYLDDAQPSLAETIASLDDCVLVNPPNTKTRYSNVGASIAGQVVSVVSHLPYEVHQQIHVLRVMGLTHSSYHLEGVPRKRVVDSFMRVADGHGGFKRRQAPLFNLGTIPAGNLFTTAGDLARLISLLAAQGKTGERQVLLPETLKQMFIPQLVTNQTGFGLGFFASRFHHHKTVQHFGAVYGFTSALVYLPEPKVGAVVLCNQDIVTGPVRTMVDRALSVMLEAKLGEPPPPAPTPYQPAAKDLAAVTGDYESASYWARVEVLEGQLQVNVSGQVNRLTPTGPDTFLANGRLESNTPVHVQRAATGQVTGFTLGQQFQRVPPGTPPIPATWKRYLGSYGQSFIPIVISERHGHLYAMTENMADYRLTPLNRHVFSLPPGMYADEHVVFLTNTRGKPYAIDFANMVLKRR